jgi:glycosyltransferase involved in cell wall biosynthesis
VSDFVTVIIPVFGADPKLPICIGCLRGQTYDKANFEVLVIDNSPQGGQALNVEADGIELRVIREPRPGSYAARNAGIAAAKGVVLAFTDADCRPSRDWLEQGVRALRDNPLCGAVAGKIGVATKNAENRTIAEQFDLVFGFNQKEFVERYHFGATANIFVHKEVMNLVGLFDDWFYSGGDVDWGLRAKAAGRSVVFSPGPQVVHPARMRIIDVLLKAVRLGAGHQQLENKYRIRLAAETTVGERRRWRDSHQDKIRAVIPRVLPRLCFICFVQVVNLAQLIGRFGVSAGLGRRRV